MRDPISHSSGRWIAATAMCRAAAFLCRILLPIGLAVAAPPLALAQDKVQTVNIGGRDVRLPLPPDSCDLDTADRRDRLLIAALDAMESSAGRPRRALRRFAPCGQLADWRSGKRATAPDLVEIAHLLQERKAEDRAAWLQASRAGQTSGRGEDVAAKWTETPPEINVAVGPFRRSAPVLLDPERDDRAIYAALLLQVPLSGRPVPLVAVASLTMANEVPLVSIATTAWEGEGAIVGWLQEEQRDLVDRILSLNGEENRRVASAAKAPPEQRRDPEDRQYRDLLSRNAGYLAIGLIAAGILSIAVGLIGSRILRRRAA